MYLCFLKFRTSSASGLVVKSDVAIVGPRVRFSAGALCIFYSFYQLLNQQHIHTYNHTYSTHTRQNAKIYPSTHSYIQHLYTYTTHILIFVTLHNTYVCIFVRLDQHSRADNTFYIILQEYVHTIIDIINKIKIIKKL